MSVGSDLSSDRSVVGFVLGRFVRRGPVEAMRSWDMSGQVSRSGPDQPLPDCRPLSRLEQGERETMARLRAALYSGD